MASYFEESVEVERKRVVELTETVKYARKYFDDFSNSIDKTADSMNSLGVDSANTSKSVKDSISKIKDSYLALKSALTPFIKAFKSISELTLDYTQQGTQIDNLVAKTGIASEVFQTLSNASKNFKGSAESTADILVSLNKNIKDVSNGGSGNGLKETLKAFDINPAGLQSVDQFLEVIAGRMEILKSATEKLDFGHALGLDDATIKVLSGGMKEYREELEKTSLRNAFSPEDMARAEELNESLREIGAAFYDIGMNIAQILLPILTPLFSEIKNRFFCYLTSNNRGAIVITSLSSSRLIANSAYNIFC